MLHAGFHPLGRYPPLLGPARSISSQVAPLASPERAAVSTRNRKHNLADYRGLG